MLSEHVLYIEIVLRCIYMVKGFDRHACNMHAKHLFVVMAMLLRVGSLLCAISFAFTLRLANESCLSFSC